MTDENKEQPEAPAMMKCAIMPQEVFQMLIDSYRDALVQPKISQQVMDQIGKRCRFVELPAGGPLVE